jgi:hypothetical protein
MPPLGIYILGQDLFTFSKYDMMSIIFDFFATLQHMQKEVKITVFSRVNHTAQALLLKCLDPSNKRSHVHCCASHSETTAYNERSLVYATSC